MDICNIITKALKESNVDAKINRNSKTPKFRVVNNKLTLEGVVSDSTYSMQIKDVKGDIIDELTVNIKDGNDVVNRINESINTLDKLSPIYDAQMKLKEDEEFEELPQAEPGDIKGALRALDDVYNAIMDLAEKVDAISDYYDNDDIEGKNNIIAYVGALYDVAMDISDYREDKIEELSEDSDAQNESIQPRKSAKNSANVALNNVTVAEAMLRGHKEYKDIQRALRNIKNELVIRNK